MLDASFSVHAVRKDRKEAISEIKFSPDDSICAVGAHDSCIFTYNAKNGFKPLKKLRGHPSTIAHFDFSLDGNYIMSNCTSYNILFFDVNAGKHNPSGASALKDETWHTWTCTFGWPVQGIFPPCADGTDINACDRAPDGTVLATADDFGMVKLFKYPCPVDRGSFN
jgi:echinoderm microtubule-associated protein-like 6